MDSCLAAFSQSVGRSTIDALTQPEDWSVTLWCGLCRRYPSSAVGVGDMSINIIFSELFMASRLGDSFANINAFKYNMHPSGNSSLESIV